MGKWRIYTEMPGSAEPLPATIWQGASATTVMWLLGRLSCDEADEARGSRIPFRPPTQAEIDLEIDTIMTPHRRALLEKTEDGRSVLEVIDSRQCNFNLDDFALESDTIS